MLPHWYLWTHKMLVIQNFRECLWLPPYNMFTSWVPVIQSCQQRGRNIYFMCYYFVVLYSTEIFRNKSCICFGLVTFQHVTLSDLLGYITSRLCSSNFGRLPRCCFLIYEIGKFIYIDWSGISSRFKSWWHSFEFLWPCDKLVNQNLFGGDRYEDMNTATVLLCMIFYEQSYVISHCFEKCLLLVRLVYFRR